MCVCVCVCVCAYMRDDDEWTRYGLTLGSAVGLMERGAWAKGKAAGVLVLLLKRCG